MGDLRRLVGRSVETRNDYYVPVEVECDGSPERRVQTIGGAEAGRRSRISFAHQRCSHKGGIDQRLAACAIATAASSGADQTPRFLVLLLRTQPMTIYRFCALGTPSTVM